MKEHEHILYLAAQGKLPDTVDSTSEPSFTLVQELVDAGYLKAIDASSLDGMAYLNPRITMAGRQYLDQLREGPASTEAKVEKPASRPSTIAPSSSGSPSAWSQIEKEYGISKKMLGKRISFVKDEFKRKIIFRDIEQAFLLADSGFNKSSVILAGGVIEELLRLYLEHRSIKPERNDLFFYIKACEENHLLKDAIQQLADSVRQFRNLVHLGAETSAKHSISKATAKGAVASVFTIANDFDR
jgi:hypothetical protein